MRELLRQADDRARAITSPILSLGMPPRSMPNVWSDGERVEIDLVVKYITDADWRALQGWLARAEYIFTHDDDEMPPLLDRSHAAVVPWETKRALDDGADALAILLGRWGIPFSDEREMPF